MTSTLRKLWAITIAISTVTTAFAVDYYAIPNDTPGWIFAVAMGLFFGAVGGRTAYKTWTGVQ